jgi:hypothetical protein
LDQVDAQREYLTVADLREISPKFAVHHLPALIVDLFSKLSGQNFKQLAYRRLKHIHHIKKAQADSIKTE